MIGKIINTVWDWKSIYRSPIFSTVVVLLAVVAGVLGSLYTEEIKTASYLGPYTGKIAWKVVIFWFSVVLFALLFFLGKRATDRASEKQTQELGKLIRTLPPRNFLGNFSKILTACDQAVAEIFARSELSTVGDIEYAIRLVLDGIVTLAKDFDGNLRKVTYAANIMLFHPSISFSPTGITELRDRLRFVETGLDVNELLGVLDLEPNLSTTTKTEEAIPDSNLSPLALPIPATPKSPDQMRWRLLPGAPMAFYTGSMEAFTDTDKLSDWCQTHGDFSPSVCIEVKEYFQGDSRAWIRSFVSLPLIKVVGEEYPTGVLNIHRDTPGLLADKEPAEHFAPLMHPFLSLLGRLSEQINSRRTMSMEAREG